MTTTIASPPPAPAAKSATARPPFPVPVPGQFLRGCRVQPRVLDVLDVLLFYYTDVAGVSAAAAGTLFLVVRAWDAFTDIFAGRLVDKTNTRWGKFRPFFLFGGLPVLLLSVAVFRDSWIVWAGDEHGTAIEVYPVGTEMVPPDGPEQAQFREAAHPSPYVATHATVSVERTMEQIRDLAAEQGWRAAALSRGPHEVVEFWIENHVMLELMTPAMEADYLAAAPRVPQS